MRVHEYEYDGSEDGSSEDESEEEEKGNVKRTQRDVPPPEKGKERELWGPVMADDIWQSCFDPGIWGPVDES